MLVAGVLTCCALLHSEYDLEIAQMNVQRNLIQVFIRYEFELGDNESKSTKNIGCAKGEGAVDHSNWMVEHNSLRLKELQ